MGADADVTIASRASGREHRSSAASSTAPTCSIMRASQGEASLSLQKLRTAADVQHRSRRSALRYLLPYTRMWTRSPAGHSLSLNPVP